MKKIVLIFVLCVAIKIHGSLIEETTHEVEQNFKTDQLAKKKKIVIDTKYINVKV